MCDTIEMLDAVGDLTGAFRPEPTKIETKGFITALEGIPVQFVKQAVQNFLRGEVVDYNPRYRPSPPQFAIEAKRLREIESPSFIVLSFSHPDFKAVEKLRGKRPFVNERGNTTVTMKEVLKARRALA